MASNSYPLRKRSSINYADFCESASEDTDEWQPVESPDSSPSESPRQQKKALKASRSSNEQSDSDEDSDRRRERREERKRQRRERKRSQRRGCFSHILEDDYSSPGASEYEKMRQKNIAEKLALLRSLNIPETRMDLLKKKAQRTEKPARDEANKPVRKSLRIQKLDPMEQQDPEVQPVPVLDNDDSKPKRHPSGPLRISDVSPNGSSLPEVFLTRFEKLTTVENEGEPSSPIQYTEYFPAMTKASSSVIQIIPDKIRSLAIHPSTSSLLVCAGSNYGDIGLWSANSQGDNGIYCILSPHVDTVRDLKFQEENHHHMFSCSDDGTIRCFDLSKLVFEEVYATSSVDIQCTYMDFLNTQTLVVGHNDGKVAIVDTRTCDNSTSCQIHQFGSKSFDTVNVHPLQKEKILLSPRTCTGEIYDLRMLSEQPSAVATFSTNKNLSSAFFSPLTGSSILATSFDDYLRLIDSSDLSGILTTKSKIRHNNQIGVKLAPFFAKWIPNSEKAFVVGSHSSQSHPRRIEIFDLSGTPIHMFTDELMTSVPPVNILHPSLPVLIGGSASGKLFIFIGKHTA